MKSVALFVVLCVVFALCAFNVQARVPRRTYALSDAKASKSGQAAANFARAQVGKGYSQANRLGPKSFDCSGLVKQAYGGASRIPSTTHGYPKSGLPTVPLKNIQPGDILHRPGHVGIYVGKNQVVNAENSRKGVQIRDLGWYQRNMKFNNIYRP